MTRIRDKKKMAAYSLKSYYKHKPEWLKRRRRYGRGKQKLLRELLAEAKKRPCADCNRSYPPICMDFDHVRGKKRFNVSAFHNFTLNPWDLFEEMAKCDIVCANCHRLRTEARRRV